MAFCRCKPVSQVWTFLNPNWPFGNFSIINTVYQIFLLDFFFVSKVLEWFLHQKGHHRLHRYPIHTVLPCHNPRCIKEYIECACSGVMACSTCHVYLVGQAQWLFVCEKEVGGRKQIQIYVYVYINMYTYIHMFLLIGSMVGMPWMECTYTLC